MRITVLTRHAVQRMDERRVQIEDVSYVLDHFTERRKSTRNGHHKGRYRVLQAGCRGRMLKVYTRTRAHVQLEVVTVAWGRLVLS